MAKFPLRRIVLVHALLFSAPATADDWVREVAGWQVGRIDDSCAMYTNFEGEGETRLSFLIDGQATDTFMTVTNYGWSAQEGEVYHLDYQLGDWVYTLSSIGVEQSIIRKGFAVQVGKDFLADFAKSKSPKIRRETTLVDSLDLAGSAAALTLLDRCRSELARDLDKKRRDRERLEHIPKDPFANAKSLEPSALPSTQSIDPELPSAPKRGDSEFEKLFNALGDQP